MGIIIDNINITPEFTSGSERSLQGNIYWKMQAEIFIRISTFAKGLVDEPLIFADPTYLNNTYITDDTGTEKFRDFNVGDIINITGGSNNFTGVEINHKVDNNTIRVNTGLAFDEDDACTIIVTTPYSGFTFFPGLVGNNETAVYESKVDGSIQKYTVEHPLVGTVDMLPGGYKSWQIPDEGVEVEFGGTSANFERFFTFRHTFYITPWNKPSLFNDLIANTPPDWFLNNECLRHVFRIEARPDLNDPNRLQVIEFEEEEGNTGWYNEKFNGEPSFYTSTTPAYERASDSQILNTIQLSNVEETKITLSINNTNDSPFVATTKLAVSFGIIPGDDSDVSNTINTVLSENFVFDRALVEANGTPIDGVRFGTGYQAIKQVTATVVSVSQVDIELTVDLGTDAYDLISSLTRQEFVLAVSTANIALATSQSDGVTLLAARDNFFVDLGLDKFTNFDISNIEHPYTDSADSTTSLCAYPEDEVTGYCRLEVDTSVLTEDLTINALNLGIFAKNPTTGQEFALSERQVSFAGTTVVNGIEFIDFNQQTAFKAPADDLIKNVIVKRDIAADASPLYYYDVFFPYLVRWEDWQILQGASGDFFDNTEPNNGLNNDWHKYDDVSPWQIVVRVGLNVTVGDTTGEVSGERQIEIVDYDTNADWNQTQELFDESSNALPVTPDAFIVGYERTRVKLTFEYVGSSAPLFPDEVGMVFRIEPENNGGQFISTRISSFREIGADSQWESIDGSDKIVMTNPSPGIYVGEAFINNTKLQENFDRFCITGRIYDLRDGKPENAFLYEDLTCWLLENGSFLLAE